MKKPSSNPWKYTTFGLMGLFAIGAAGVVVAAYSGRETPSRPPASVRNHPQVAYDAPPRQAAARPAPADVRVCNEYAASDKAKESFKNGLIGSALGAALGAAGGAIVDGGKGAGKGAGIGALVGAAGGSLYGLNKANQEDERSIAAYDACMRRAGY